MNEAATRRERLEALRGALEQALSSDVPVRDFAALSREYRACLADIASLPDEMKAGDPIDEIAARRRSRGAVAAPVQRRPASK